MYASEALKTKLYTFIYRYTSSISCICWDSYNAYMGILTTQTFPVCHLVQPCAPPSCNIMNSQGLFYYFVVTLQFLI